MFTIQRITARTHDQSFGGYKWKVEVTVVVDAKAWAKLKAKRQLGMLYGVDISNAVYAINRNIPASCPMVSDHARASKGLKRITMTYFLDDPDMAEGLGLKVIRQKNGDVYGSYSDFVSIEVPREQPSLSLVK